MMEIEFVSSEIVDGKVIIYSLKASKKFRKSLPMATFND